MLLAPQSKMKGHESLIENCLRCSRPLTNPVSMYVGFGPICSAYLGLERPEYEELLKFNPEDNEQLAKLLAARQVLEAANNIEGSVKLNEEKIIIEFEWECKDFYKIKDSVKSLGARWNPDEKQWVASKERGREIAESLQKFPNLAIDEDLFSLEKPTSKPAGLSLSKPVIPGYCKFIDNDLAVSLTLGVPNFSKMKDAIKNLGARWNPEKKYWTYPIHFEKANQVISTLEKYGIFIPEEIKTTLANLQSEKERTKIMSTATDADIEITGLNGTLYPFQKAGVAYAIKKEKVLIADEMGLGKTCQAIAWLQATNSFPAIIVVPASLKLNWQREINKWLPEKRVIILSGTGKNVEDSGNGGDAQAENSAIDKSDITVINYDILSPRLEQLQKRDFKAIVLDESHYVKNKDANRSKACMELRKGIPLRMCLTGTPVLNRPNELIQPLSFLGRLNELGGFWNYVKRYCLPPDAPILMANLTEKPINKINIGDKIIGWTRSKSRYYKGTTGTLTRRLCESEVLAVLKRQAPLVKVTLEDRTELICTPDHRWLNGRGEHNNPNIEYSIARIGRLGGRGKGCASRIVKIFQPPKPLYEINENNNDYRYGYIIGAFRGDGWCSQVIHETFHPFQNKHYRYISTHRIGIACNDIEIIERIKLYLNHFDIPFTTPSRSDNMPSINIGHEKGYNFITQSPIDTDAWWAGFLGGIYDTEGSGQVISQEMNINQPTYEMICKGLTRFNISYTKPKDGKGIRMIGGRSTLIKFWGITSPVLQRKLKNYVFNAGGRFSNENLSKMKSASFVKSIETIPGIHEVYTLTTTTGNYVAYGCGSQNCNAHQTQWGWDMSGASNLSELNSKLRETCMVRRRKEDVLKELPDKQRVFIPVELDEISRIKYDDAVNNFAFWLEEYRGKKLEEKAKTLAPGAVLETTWLTRPEYNPSYPEQLVKIEILKQLAVKGKLDTVKEWISDFLETGEKLVVFAHHKEIIAELANAYPDNTRAVLIGDTTMPNRQSAVDKFQTDGACQLFIGSMKAAGVGITLTAASNVAFIELGWTPADHDQAEDRCHRIGQKDAVTAYYFIAENTIENDIYDLILSKRDVVNMTTDGTIETNVIEKVMQRLMEKYGRTTLA